MRVVNRYLTKREKTYYLTRRVPDDVRHLHPTGTIRGSLNTSDVATARTMRNNRIKELEARWDAFAERHSLSDDITRLVNPSRCRI
jgi:hypothetical protein